MFVVKNVMQFVDQTWVRIKVGTGGKPISIEGVDQVGRRGWDSLEVNVFIADNILKLFRDRMAACELVHTFRTAVLGR